MFHFKDIFDSRNIFVGLYGLLTAFLYKPDNLKSLENSILFCIVLLVIGAIPNIGGVWHVFDYADYSRKAAIVQFLLHAFLTAVQLIPGGSLLFSMLRDESLSPLFIQAARPLILAAVIAFWIQSVMLGAALRRLQKTDSRNDARTAL